MMRSRRILFPLAALAFANACGRPPPDLAASSPVAVITLQKAKQRTVHEVLSAYGTADYAIDGAHSVVIQAEAQVVDVLVAAGDSVHRGQALLRLTPTSATRLDVDKARRDAGLARSEQARLIRLHATGLATDGELEAATAAADAAAALSASLARREGAGVDWLRAPANGVVEPFAIVPGDVLAAGSTVFRIGRADALTVRLGFEPEAANRLAIGQRVDVELSKSAMLAAVRISSIDRRIDPLTHQISALIELPRGTTLLAGSLVRAQVVLSTHDDAVVVPRGAIVYNGSEAAVFVDVNGHAVRRPIKAGLIDGDDVEVVEGLPAGADIVTVGAYELEDGMLLKVDAGLGEVRTAEDKTP